MTPNAKWSLRVCEIDKGLCAAMRHDPRCRGIGEHAHHINYKSHIPKALHFTVVENGIWLSSLCHTLAHRTHNESIPRSRRDLAAGRVRSEILRLFPSKPELLLHVEVM